MHGFSLNCQKRVLPWFEHIIPCGFADRTVTSLESEISGNKELGLSSVSKRLIDTFGTTFDTEMKELRSLEIYD